MDLPVILLTMGDPSGIGPEILVKAFQQHHIFEKCKPVVIGDQGVLAKAAEICSVNLKINLIEHVAEGLFQPGTLDLVDLNNVNLNELKYGKIQAMSGQAAFDYIKKAVELTEMGWSKTITTTPINKESLKAAGVDFIGHTEILAGLSNTDDPLTMFEVNELRTFFLSRHVSLRKACDLVKKDKIIEYTKRSIDSLKMIHANNGPFAIAGLNPHCGDGGMFGDEELTEIIPAIEELKKQGYHVIGPMGADSVFHVAMQNRWAGVLSLYHDQGHIATKTYNFEKTISVTLGLPFLRTSVDHGTAFDIAGTGKASEVSMIEAILVGAKYAQYL